MSGYNVWGDSPLATFPLSLFVLSGPAPSPFKRDQPLWTFCPVSPLANVLGPQPSEIA